MSDRKADPEIAAMKKCVEILSQLEPTAQKRAVAYLVDRYVDVNVAAAPPEKEGEG